MHSKSDKHALRWTEGAIDFCKSRIAFVNPGEVISGKTGSPDAEKDAVDWWRLR
jgi:hypothetical protein